MENEVTRAIEVRVEQLSQLFDTLDPFPFRERDLDKDAEEFIVGWARELPRNQPINIIIHAPAAELRSEYANEIAPALKRYFNYRADVVGRDLNELFRIGRRSLLIGLTVLGACILLSRAVLAVSGAGNFSRFTEEGFIILGWVANWKPIEIFLYEWWPLARRRDLYRSLAVANVELRPTEPDKGRDDRLGTTPKLQAITARQGQPIFNPIRQGMASVSLGGNDETRNACGKIDATTPSA